MKVIHVLFYIPATATGLLLQLIGQQNGSNCQLAGTKVIESEYR